MFEKSISTVMRRSDVLKLSPSLSVAEAARRMAKKNVGAVVVMEGERLVGIFTERDIVFRVVARGLDLNDTRIADAMTPAPYIIGPDEPFGCASVIMHEKGFRHMPVMKNSKLVGIVSARSALDPELEDFVSEAERRKYFLAEYRRHHEKARR
jgi:CBS domain-containing protein